MTTRLFFGLFAIGITLSAPLAAQTAEDDIVNNIINLPPPAAFNVNGLKSKPKVRNDEAVQGGKALRIQVPGKSERTWEVSVNDEINKPVKAGDQLVMAFWARLVEGENGATTAELPYNAVQLSKDPYTTVINGPATIGPEWKLHEVKGRADKDYAAGELNATLHLATGKQTIDLGPMFVLNLGQ
jgi:hypothetical protein